MARLEAGPGTKQQNWERVSKLVADIEPTQPIDGSVRDIVTAMNLLGIETVDSCGGHRIRREVQGPVVVFVNRKVQAEGEGTRYERLSVHEHAKKMRKYLEEFYEKRRVRSGSRLIVQERDRFGYMYNQGNEHRMFTWYGPKRVVGRIELYLYQRQIEQFGNFLKEKYLASSDEFSSAE